MRRRWIGLALLLAASSGCVSGFPFTVPSADKAPPNKTPTPFVAPITASQINPQNAHLKAQDIWDELDREAKTESLPAEKGRKK